MKLNTLFAINAVVAVLFGLAFVLAPGLVLSNYGLSADDTASLLARLLGVEFIGYNIVTWLARQMDSKQARRYVVLSHVVSESLAGIVALIAQLSGLLNPMGWTSVGIYLLFALAYAYFLFVKPSAI